MAEVQDISFQVARLRLSPDDTLVVKAVDTTISDLMAERVRRQVSDATGHAKVMVIDATIDLSILEAPQAEVLGQA
jgi:hypothetical protein